MCSWDETILVFLMSGGSTISLINNIVLNLSYIQPPPYGFFLYVNIKSTMKQLCIMDIKYV